MKFEILQNGKVELTKELGEGSYKIGRASDCDIVLESNQVSKHHALLVVRGERAAILDTGSSNGTFVNGILIKKQLLKESDIIEIGGYKIQNALHVKPKKNIEVYPSEGALALDREPVIQSLDSPESEPMGAQEMAPAAQLSAAEKWVGFVDNKLLLPFYEIVRVTDYRFLLAVILVVSIGVAAFFSVTPLLSWGNEITKQESIKRGHTIIKQVVRENYRILNKSKDSTLLTVAAAESEKDMLDIYVVDTRTKSVLAPTKYLSKSLNDPYVLIALEDLIDKRNSEVTKERRDGTFVLAQSIP